MKYHVFSIFLSSFFLLNGLQLQAQGDILEKLNDIAIVDQKVMMPMRDGIRLATDIYRPKTDAKVPIIFSRTPYNFNSWRDGKENTRTATSAYEAVKSGYAYVVQNERGRYYSEGECISPHIVISLTNQQNGEDAKQATTNNSTHKLLCSNAAHLHPKALSP